MLLLYICFATGGLLGFACHRWVWWSWYARKQQTRLEAMALELGKAQDSEKSWQNLAAERLRNVADLKASVGKYHTDLQSARNSLHEQAALLRARDICLAEQRREAALASDDLMQAHKTQLAKLREQANEIDKGRQAAVANAMRLETAIKVHHGKRGHECCHLNDNELYAVVGLEPPDPALPPLGEFLPKCMDYWFDKQGLPRPSAKECCTRPPDMVGVATLEKVIALLSGDTFLQSDEAWLRGLGFGFSEADGGIRLVSMGAITVDPTSPGFDYDQLVARWSDALSKATSIPGKTYRVLEG